LLVGAQKKTFQIFFEMFSWSVEIGMV